MSSDEILEVLELKGAILHGHFRLSSGRHSDLFVQKFRVLEDPQTARSLGESLARNFDGDFDVVAAPAVGAIVLGFATALAAEARSIFAERSGDAMVFRRGFSLGREERVLVVEDVVTTGGSAREVVDLVRASGARVAGVGALIDRSEASAPPDFGAPLRALVRLKTRSWEPEECPLCAARHPISDPGSRRLEV
ncbi:MAG: orotate phosphoribosyltransferase [Actinomycetota bacterium]|nr:orotate phosphoribosyltransferase [Actinomycetota bacterium]